MTKLLTEINAITESYKGTINITDGLTFNQWETLRMVEFYTNSKYMKGDMDSLGRFKPFYNIVNFRVNTAVKGTDLDTKDIQVYTDNPTYYVRSMIFNKEVKNWMRATFFSKVLNEINETRARYGGVLVKRVMKDGKLTLEVPEWKNLVTDRVNITNFIMEKHYLTWADLVGKKDVWNNMTDDNMKMIEGVMKAQHEGDWYSTARVCIGEIEGTFPKSYLNDSDDDDSDEYCLQRHFVLLDGEVKASVVLDSSEKKESDYKYKPWVKTAGRGLGIGIVEDGFHAQYSTNDVVLKERDIMEIASKVVYLTDSDTVENNIITDVDTGDIITIEQNERFELVNSMPSSVPALREIAQAWDEQYSRVTGTFEAVTGETMPSGTPFRAIAIQNQEAQSGLNYRREDFGIFLNEIFTDWVLPYVKKLVNKEHVLAADFEEDELKKIDTDFSRFTANNFVIDQLIEGRVTTQEEYDQMIQQQTELLNSGFKSKRFIKTPEGYYDDVEIKLDILTTGEQINKSAVFETISNIITTVAANPAVLQDPVLRKLMMKIIELSGIGISLDFNQTQVPQQPQMAQPVDISAENSVDMSGQLPPQ